MNRQRQSLTRSQENAFNVNRVIQDQLLSDTNRRFEEVLRLTRELQRTVNQLTPAGIKDQIRESVNVDPLIPRADRFEQNLKEMEKKLKESEVSLI